MLHASGRQLHSASGGSSCSFQGSCSAVAAAANCATDATEALASAAAHVVDRFGTLLSVSANRLDTEGGNAIDFRQLVRPSPLSLHELQDITGLVRRSASDQAVEAHNSSPLPRRGGADAAASSDSFTFLHAVSASRASHSRSVAGRGIEDLVSAPLEKLSVGPPTEKRHVVKTSVDLLGVDNLQGDPLFGELFRTSDALAPLIQTPPHSTSAGFDALQADTDMSGRTFATTTSITDTSLWIPLDIAFDHDSSVGTRSSEHTATNGGNPRCRHGTVQQINPALFHGSALPEPSSLMHARLSDGAKQMPKAARQPTGSSHTSSMYRLVAPQHSADASETSQSPMQSLLSQCVQDLVGNAGGGKFPGFPVAARADPFAVVAPQELVN